jgi:esterase/lipase superfamily enzyme
MTISLLEWEASGPTGISVNLEFAPGGDGAGLDDRVARLELGVDVNGVAYERRVELQDVPGGSFYLDLPLPPDVARDQATLRITVRIAASGGSAWHGDVALLRDDELLWIDAVHLQGGGDERASRDVTVVTRRLQMAAGLTLGPTWRDLIRTAKQDDVDADDVFNDLELNDEESSSGRVYRVWYATDRTPFHADGKTVGYGAGRAEETAYGACDVLVPRWHELGQVSSSLLQCLRGRDGTLSLTHINPMAPEAFWQGVAGQVSRATDSVRHAAVFLHGYRVGFREAVIRAAQLGVDLKISGAMGVFAWPSEGRLIGYTRDESAIEGSELRIEQYVTQFAQRSGADTVHIIAHSMGNRALLRAVERIVLRAQAAAPDVRFGQIVLAAPDVTAALFQQLASTYQHVAERTTLYVSDGDRALKASQLLHGPPRLGSGVPVISAKGAVDTVVASAVNRTFLGHGYVAEAREILADMHAAIHFGAPPDKRVGLERRDTPNGPYWVMTR